MVTLEELQRNVYDKDNISKLEAKFELIEQTSDSRVSIYNGRYPLQPFRDDQRGVYGGEFVSQGVLAAWKTLSDPELTPHSLHGYFVKAGSNNSVVRWEVENVSDGRNFANRLLRAFQTHTDVLVFTLQVSFTKNNDGVKRREVYEEQLAKGVENIRSIPFLFQKVPNPLFYQFKDNIDSLPSIEHTHEFMTHAFTPDAFRLPKVLNHETIGSRQLGLFAKINEDPSLATDKIKSKYTAALYLSDSLFITLVMSAVGVAISEEEKNFFRVSLDHAVYFHDLNFDARDWLFIDFKFPSMGNDRALVLCNFYTLDGRLVFSVNQEFLCFFPKKIIDKSNSLHEKYLAAQNSQESAKL